MDMVIREELLKAPQRCSICQQPQGDGLTFVDVHVKGLEIKTAEGPKKIDGSVYVCVGSEHKPGCLSQMAEKWGAKLPWQEDEMRAAATVMERDLRAEITQLEVELASARASQTLVVPLADVLAGMGQAAPVVVGGDQGDVHRRRLRAVPLDAEPELLPPAPPAAPHPDSAAFRMMHGLGNREGRAGAMIGETIRGGGPVFSSTAPSR